jgi:pimeloyl-ACP methyl ester carboxylesterase
METILEQIRAFSGVYGKTLTVDGIPWRYYRLGQGPALLWLTGGLRRAAFGFGFMQAIARTHTLIAPDYPPVMTIRAFLDGFDAILQAEGVGKFSLGGQSYGSLLAQAYLAHRQNAVEQLIISSGGPADYGRAWLPVEILIIALVRILPEKMVKSMLAEGLLKVVSVDQAQCAEWETAIRETLQNDLARVDIVSHFAVAADVIQARLVHPGAFKDWAGKVSIFSAENDPTQSQGDFPRYEKLFGRPIQVINMGSRGHTAALLDPVYFAALLDQALAF